MVELIFMFFLAGQPISPELVKGTFETEGDCDAVARGLISAAAHSTEFEQALYSDYNTADAMVVKCRVTL